MIQAGGRRGTFGAVACGLIALFFLIAFTESRYKSAAFDEPAHIAAALSYLESGKIVANQQHPPLLKEISAVFMRMGGVEWPRDRVSDALIQGNPQPLEWAVGESILTRNGPDRVLFWARLPFLFFGVLLGAAIYLLGRKAAGPLAAVCAVFLFAMDPSILAHTSLVTMDVGLAAFATLFLFALWMFLEKPDWKRLLLAGLALGAMLGAKFSGAFLVPVALVLLVAALRWPLGTGLQKKQSPLDPYGAVAPDPNGNCPCGSGKKYRKCHGAKPTAPDLVLPDMGSRAAICLAAFCAMCVLAFLVLQVLYFFPSDPLQYVKGASRVNFDHNTAYQAFMAGEMQPRFATYFLVTWLLKESVPAIVLALIGAVVVWRSRTMPLVAKLFLFLPPLTILTAHSLWADDLGIRYIMAALPFAFLLGGAALANMFTSPARWPRYVAILLCGWSAVASVGAYPDHLSYFNESACLLTDPSQTGLDGGSHCGTRWLDDSNVDWGQGLKQLKTWLDAHASGRTPKLAYFGSVRPEDYGIRYEPLDSGGFGAAPHARPLCDQRPPGRALRRRRLAARSPPHRGGRTRPLHLRHPGARPLVCPGRACISLPRHQAAPHCILTPSRKAACCPNI